MKLGDIKVEALRLMFMGGALEIGADQLVDFADDQTYGYYLSRMPGAINRAFSIIERRRVLPVKAVRLIATEERSTARFHLEAVAPDLYDVERITCEREGHYDASVDYHLEGDELIVQDMFCRAEHEKDACYTLLYRPRIERVSAGTDDQKEIDIPDEIAEVIPYAVKGDLFRDDESDEAEAARARFEYALNEIATAHSSGQVGTVATVYGGGLML